MEFIVPLENCSHILRRHHCRWRAANFDLYSWPLNSEGSLTCHTHCDTCLPHTRDTHTCCRAVPTCFYDLGLSRPGIEPRSPAYEASGLSLRHRGVIIKYSEIYSKKKTARKTPWFIIVLNTFGGIIFICKGQCLVL